MHKFTSRIIALLLFLALFSCFAYALEPTQNSPPGTYENIEYGICANPYLLDQSFEQAYCGNGTGSTQTTTLDFCCPPELNSYGRQGYPLNKDDCRINFFLSSAGKTISDLNYCRDFVCCIHPDTAGKCTAMQIPSCIRAINRGDGTKTLYYRSKSTPNDQNSDAVCGYDKGIEEAPCKLGCCCQDQDAYLKAKGACEGTFYQSITERDPCTAKCLGTCGTTGHTFEYIKGLETGEECEVSSSDEEWQDQCKVPDRYKPTQPAGPIRPYGACTRFTCSECQCGAELECNNPSIECTTPSDQANPLSSEFCQRCKIALPAATYCQRCGTDDLCKGYSLIVIVSSNEGNLKDAIATLKQGDKTVATKNTDANGKVQFDNVKGIYTIEVAKQGYKTEKETFEIKEALQKSYKLARSTCPGAKCSSGQKCNGGTYIDSEDDGSPAEALCCIGNGVCSSFTVTLQVQNNLGNRLTGIKVQQSGATTTPPTTDANGEVSFQGLKKGSHRFTLTDSANIYTLKTVDVTLTESSPISSLYPIILSTFDQCRTTPALKIPAWSTPPIALTALGGLKATLKWTDNCKADSFSVYRCMVTGTQNCQCAAQKNDFSACKTAGFQLMGQSTGLSFIDSHIVEDKTYTYMIEAKYGSDKFYSQPQPVTVSSICIANPDKQYCSDDRTQRLFCTGNPIPCTSGLCVEKADGKTECASAPDCSSCNAPLGIYGEITGAAAACANPLCYLELSKTTTDAHKGCIISSASGTRSVESCYDYKSKTACAKNTCLSGRSCIWQPDPVYGELGFGVCRELSEEHQGCMKCNTYYTDSDDSYTLIEGCTAQRCNTFGRCIFYDNQCLGTDDDVTCNKYISEFDCVGSPPKAAALKPGNVLEPSTDKFAIGTCKFIARCMKDANGNNLDDCTEESSFGTCDPADNTPPETIALDTPRLMKELVLTVQEITVYDNGAVVPGSQQLNTIRTYFCIASKGQSCVPKDSFVGQSNTGFRSIGLGSGEYTLFYYSEDASHNLERIKSVDFKIDAALNIALTYNVQEKGSAGSSMAADLAFNVNALGEEATCSFTLTTLAGTAKSPASPPSAEPSSLWFITYPDLTKDEYAFKYDCHDLAGNQRTNSINIKIDPERLIDNELPTGTIKLPDNREVALSVKTKFQGECRYSLKGEQNFYLMEKTLAKPTAAGADGLYLHTATATLERVSAEKRYKVQCKRDIDNALIPSPLNDADSIHFYVDVDPPQTLVTLSPLDIETVWHNTVTIDLICKDETAAIAGHEFGCAQLKDASGNPIPDQKGYIKYSIDNIGTTSPIPAQLGTTTEDGLNLKMTLTTANFEGPKILAYFSADAAGNRQQSNYQSKTIKLDKTPPVVESFKIPPDKTELTTKSMSTTVAYGIKNDGAENTASPLAIAKIIVRKTGATEPVIEQSITGLNNYGATTGQATVTLPRESTDGTYEVTLDVKDAAGNENSKDPKINPVLKIIYDHTGPNAPDFEPGFASEPVTFNSIYSPEMSTFYKYDSDNNLYSKNTQLHITGFAKTGASTSLVTLFVNEVPVEYALPEIKSQVIINPNKVRAASKGSTTVLVDEDLQTTDPMFAKGNFIKFGSADKDDYERKGYGSYKKLYAIKDFSYDKITHVSTVTIDPGLERDIPPTTPIIAYDHEYLPNFFYFDATLKKGVNDIRLQGKDQIGNIGPSNPPAGSYKVFVDTDSPVIEKTKIPDPVSGDQNPLITFTVKDKNVLTSGENYAPSSGFRHASFTLNKPDGSSDSFPSIAEGQLTKQEGNGEISYTYNYQARDLQNGQYKATFSFTDKAGNSAQSAQITFTVSAGVLTQRPSISFIDKDGSIKPANMFKDQYVFTGRVEQGKLTDKGVRLVFDGEQNIVTPAVTLDPADTTLACAVVTGASTPTFDCSFADKTKLDVTRDYTINVQAKRLESGQAASFPYTLIIDTANPNIRNIQTDSIVNSMQQGIDLSFDIDEPNLYPVNLQIIADPTALNSKVFDIEITPLSSPPPSINIKYNLPVLSSGNHELKLIVTDRAGNSDTETKPIEVDTTPPSINLDTIALKPEQSVRRQQGTNKWYTRLENVKIEGEFTEKNLKYVCLATVKGPASPSACDDGTKQTPAVSNDKGTFSFDVSLKDKTTEKAVLIEDQAENVYSYKIVISKLPPLDKSMLLANLDTGSPFYLYSQFNGQKSADGKDVEFRTPLRFDSNLGPGTANVKLTVNKVNPDGTDGEPVIREQSLIEYPNVPGTFHYDFQQSFASVGWYKAIITATPADPNSPNFEVINYLRVVDTIAPVFSLILYNEAPAATQRTEPANNIITTGRTYYTLISSAELSTISRAYLKFTGSKGVVERDITLSTAGQNTNFNGEFMLPYEEPFTNNYATVEFFVEGKDINNNNGVMSSQQKTYTLNSKGPIAPVFDPGFGSGSTGQQAFSTLYPGLFYLSAEDPNNADDDILFTKDNLIITGSAQDAISVLLHVNDIVKEYSMTTPEYFNVPKKEDVARSNAGSTAIIVRPTDLTRTMFNPVAGSTFYIKFANHDRVNYGFYKEFYPISSFNFAAGISTISLGAPLEQAVPENTLVTAYNKPRPADRFYFGTESFTLAKGLNRISARAKDQLGNIGPSTAVYNVFYDANTPVVHSASPAADTVLGEDRTSISFVIKDKNSVAEPSSMFKGAEFTLSKSDGSTVFATTLSDQSLLTVEEKADGYIYYTYQYEASSLQNGAYSAVFKLTDRAGNSVAGQTSFSILKGAPTKPSLTLVKADGTERTDPTRLIGSSYYIFTNQISDSGVKINFADETNVELVSAKLDANDLTCTPGTGKVFACNLALEQKNYVFHVKARRILSPGNYGETAQFDYNLIVDSVPPAITNINFDNVVKSAQNIDVSFNANEENFDAVVTIDGSPDYATKYSSVAHPATLKYTIPTLNSGQHSLSVAVTDFAGNQKTEARNIIIDNDIPSVLASSINVVGALYDAAQDKWKSKLDSVTITGEFNEANLDYICDNDNCAATTTKPITKTFSISASLKSNPDVSTENKKTLKIKDLADWTNTFVVTIVRDSTLPIVDFTAGQNIIDGELFTDKTNPLVRLTADRPVRCSITYDSSLFTGYTVYSDGYNTPSYRAQHDILLDKPLSADLTQQYVTTNLAIECYDELGNKKALTKKVNVDIKKPAITSLIPNPAILKEGSVDNFELFLSTDMRLEAEASETASCRYSIGAEKPYDEMTSFSAGDPLKSSIITLEDQHTYDFYVICRDRVGLDTETKHVIVEVDLSALRDLFDVNPRQVAGQTTYVKTLSPDVNFKTFVYAECVLDQVFKGGNPIIDFIKNIFNSMESLTHVQGRYYWYHTLKGPLSDFVKLEEGGSYEFDIICKDNTNREFSGKIGFTVDTQLNQPSVASLNPKPQELDSKYLTNQNLMTITGAIDLAGDVSGLASFVARVGSKEYQATISDKTFTITGIELSPGENTVELIVTDKAGNTVSQSLKVVYASEGPNVIQPYPADNALVSRVSEIRAVIESPYKVPINLDTTTIEVSYLGKDGTASPVNINGVLGTDGANTRKFTPSSALADGFYKFKVTPYDTLGTKGAVLTISFKQDSTLPEIQLSSPVELIGRTKTFITTIRPLFRGTVTTTRPLTEALLYINEYDPINILPLLSNGASGGTFSFNMATDPGLRELKIGNNRFMITTKTTEATISYDSGWQSLFVDISGAGAKRAIIS